MKNYLLLLTMLLSIASFGQSTQAAKVKTKTKTVQATATPKVYICNSSTAYAYHSSENCSGLNRCTHSVSGVSVSEAENNGRRPCKKCY